MWSPSVMRTSLTVSRAAVTVLTSPSAGNDITDIIMMPSTRFMSTECQLETFLQQVINFCYFFDQQIQFVWRNFISSEDRLPSLPSLPSCLPSLSGEGLQSGTDQSLTSREQCTDCSDCTALNYFIKEKGTLWCLQVRPEVVIVICLKVTQSTSVRGYSCCLSSASSFQICNNEMIKTFSVTAVTTDSTTDWTASCSSFFQFRTIFVTSHGQSPL